MIARREALRRAARLVIVALVAACVGRDAIAEPRRPGDRAVVVTARPITAFHPSEPERSRFGDLEFLGGLVLTGDRPEFQSFSALVSRDHGRQLLSASDEGTWLLARLKTDDAGRPQAIEDARLAPLLDARGRPFANKWQSDSESLTIRPARGGGYEALVGFEGNHRVLSYRFGGDWADLLDARGQPASGMPPDLGTLRPNKGIEAMAVPPPGSPLAGSLLLIAEEPRPGEFDQPAWIVGGPRPGLFHLARHDDFANTDAGFLPGGDLLVLQRRFGLRTGLGMRLIRVRGADIAADRLVEGRVLLSADGGWQIDNMEGLAIDTAPDGATILTLISDDNGNWFQRTVLLRFRLHEPEK